MSSRKLNDQLVFVIFDYLIIELIIFFIIKQQILIIGEHNEAFLIIIICYSVFIKVINLKFTSIGVITKKTQISLFYD